MRLVLFAGILIAGGLRAELPLSLITLMALGRGTRSLTVFEISDLQGLQVKNWVTGHGFGFDGALFTGSDNPMWMRCARMPLPIWTIVGLRIVFGSGLIAVNVGLVGATALRYSNVPLKWRSPGRSQEPIKSVKKTSGDTCCCILYCVRLQLVCPFAAKRLRSR